MGGVTLLFTTSSWRIYYSGLMIQTSYQVIRFCFQQACVYVRGSSRQAFNVVMVTKQITFAVSQLSLVWYFQLSTDRIKIISNLYCSIATQKARYYGRDSHKLYAGALKAKFQSITEVKMHFESSRCNCQERIISEEMKSHSICQADSIHEHQNAVKQYNYVVSNKFNQLENPETLWRYGRACYCFYSYSSTSKEEKGTAIMDGLKATEKAVLLDPQNAHAFLVSFMYITTVYCSLYYCYSVAWPTYWM